MFDGVKRVSELRSAVESLRGETLSELPDARIEEDFAEIRRIVDQLELEALRRLAEIERRGLFQRDGHLSAAAWLASAFKMSWGVARDQVRTARALDEMPATLVAVEAGDVSMCVGPESGRRARRRSHGVRGSGAATRRSRAHPLGRRSRARRGVLATGASNANAGSRARKRSARNADCTRR